MIKEICITCCWEGLVHGAWLLAKLAFWPAVVYGAIYAIGAIVFLANLRAKVGPLGRLEVEWNSWAYMLARPVRYGKIKAAVKRYGSLEKAIQSQLDDDWFRTSICPIYFRLINMLLFVWPVLLVYLVGVSVLGTVVFGGLFGVGYVRPDFSNNAWVDVVMLRSIDSWPNGWRFMLRMPITYYAAALLLIVAVTHFGWLLHGMWVALLVILCLLPLIGVIAAVVFASRKVMREKDDGETRVGMAAEYMAAKKDGWCKIVEIK